MPRTLATLATVPAVGDTVFTTRTGRTVYTVVAVEPQPEYPDHGPLIHVTREVRSGTRRSVRALSEVWVETRRVSDQAPEPEPEQAPAAAGALPTLMAGHLATRLSDAWHTFAAILPIAGPAAEPDAVRISAFTEDGARAIAAHMIQEGFDVARRGKDLTVTRPEPTEPEPAADVYAAVPTFQPRQPDGYTVHVTATGEQVGSVYRSIDGAAWIARDIDGDLADDGKGGPQRFPTRADAAALLLDLARGDAENAEDLLLAATEAETDEDAERLLLAATEAPAPDSPVRFLTDVPADVDAAVAAYRTAADRMTDTGLALAAAHHVEQMLTSTDPGIVSTERRLLSVIDTERAHRASTARDRHRAQLEGPAAEPTAEDRERAAQAAARYVTDSVPPPLTDVIAAALVEQRAAILATVRAHLAGPLAAYDKASAAWREANDSGEGWNADAPSVKDAEGYSESLEEAAHLFAHLARALPEHPTAQPAAGSDTWGWQGDPREHGEDRPERPMPEGLAVYAHWSRVHAGINVEMDVPDGTPITVHINDWQAVKEVIGQPDAEFPWNPDEDDEEPDAWQRDGIGAALGLDD